LTVGLFRTGFDESTVALSADDSGQARLSVTAAPGCRVDLDLTDGLTTVGFRFVDRVAAAENVRQLVGQPLWLLRRQSVEANSFDVPNLRSEIWVPLGRLALLEAFAGAGYFPSGTSGLVAAERLALTSLLSDAGMLVDRMGERLADSSVNAILRFIRLRPGEGASMAATAVRAALRYLPDDHPARAPLDALLADVGDPETVSLWTDLELASLMDSAVSVQPLFRGEDDPVAVSAPPWQWPVLWPDDVRPVGVEAETAHFIVEPHEAVRTLDVIISPAPAPSTSPFPCVRAVQAHGGKVLAAAPLFGDDQESRGHLYLDLPFDPVTMRIEVAAFPDAPVLSASAYDNRLLGALCVGYLRSDQVGDRDLAEKIKGQFGRLRRVDAVPRRNAAREWEPFLADQYGIVPPHHESSE
jgi:hypothetical protein